MSDVTVSELCRELAKLNERRGEHYIAVWNGGACSLHRPEDESYVQIYHSAVPLLAWLRQQNTPPPPTPAEDVEASLQVLALAQSAGTFTGVQIVELRERLTRLRKHFPTQETEAK